MTDKNQQERPFALMLVTSNITKKEVDKIIKNLEHLDCKAYVKGDIVKLTFPLRTAIKITLEEFADILYESTLRVIHGYQEDSMIHFKFSDTVDEVPQPPSTKRKPVDTEEIDNKPIKKTKETKEKKETKKDTNK